MTIIVPSDTSTVQALSGYRSISFVQSVQTAKFLASLSNGFDILAKNNEGHHGSVCFNEILSDAEWVANRI